MADAKPDTLVYTSNGTPMTLVPRDQSAGWPSGRPVAKIYIDRKGTATKLADCGEWVLAGDPSIILPERAAQAVVDLVAGHDPRGDGCRNKSLKQARVRGFEQNIIVDQDGQYEWADVRTTDAWRDDPDQQTEGQGLYVDAGSHTITGLYAARNGWKPGLPPRSKNIYRHGIYWNTHARCRDVLTDLILSENASVGGQFRGPIKARRVFCHRNAIGLLLIFGPHEIDELTIYGGSHHFDGTHWTANIGLDLYGHLKLTDGWIVAGPPVAPPAVPGAKTFDGPAVCCSATHRQYPTTPGGSLEAKDCLIAGWPGGAFGGDRQHDGSGFTVKPNAVDVDAQVRDLLDKIESNQMGIAEGQRRLSRVVRDAVH